MKKIICLFILGIVIASCGPVKATWPENSKLCYSDFDCLENEYCGFVPGYTAAVCR